jgi:glycosyltransferase involved in cell wall biosynthesis
MELTNKVGFLDYPKDDRQLMGMLASCDVGIIYTWRPDWPSHWLSLPNRLMEYTLCGLPIIATKQPEFVAFQAKTGHCVLFHGEKEQELSNAIDRVETDAVELKKMAERASSSISWRTESEVLLRVHAAISSMH